MSRLILKTKSVGGAAPALQLQRSSSQPQLSPRLVDDNGSRAPLARSSSTSSREPSPVPKKNSDMVVDKLIRRGQLGKLLIAVRQRGVDVEAIDFAFLKRAQEKNTSEFVLALGAVVSECKTSVVHEIAREGDIAVILWLQKNTPELLLCAREPDTDFTALHICALTRDDADSEPMCAGLWSKLDAKELNVKDAAGYTIEDYLAVRNHKHALAIVRVKLKKKGEQAESLRVLHLERDLVQSLNENKKLRHNHDAAMQEAEDLRAMHGALDRALVDKDAKLSERDRQVEQLHARLTTANNECDELRRAQNNLGARSAQNQNELKRSTEEMASAKKRAAEAEAKLAKAENKLRDSEQQVQDAVAKHRRISALLDTSSQELAIARSTSDSRLKEIESANAALLVNQAAAEARLAEENRLRKQYRDESQQAKEQLAELVGELETTRANMEAAQNETEQLRKETNILQAALREQNDKVLAMSAESERKQRRRRKKKEDDVSEEFGVVVEITELQQKLEAREAEMSELQTQLQSSTRLYISTPHEAVLNANGHSNRDLFERIAKAVDSSDFSLVQKYLDLGVNPNTCDMEGRPLLEIGVNTAIEIVVREANKMLDEKQVRSVTDSCTRTLGAIISAGGTWAKIDEFISSKGARAFPGAIYKLLLTRDDLTLFAKALFSDDENGAIAALNTVDDFMRIPNRYSKEQFTYLHLAAAKGFARLVHHMVLRDNVDANRRDAKGRAPLHLLLQKCTDNEKRRHITKYLLAAGAQPSLVCNYTKLTPRSKARLKLSTTEPENTGTPLSFAQFIGAHDVATCMQQKRFLRATLAPNDYGALVLPELIVSAVALKVKIQQLAVEAGSELYRLFLRYGDVFFHHKTAIPSIYVEAGVANPHLLAEDNSEQVQMLTRLVNVDETKIMVIMAGSESGVPGTDSEAVQTVCKLLSLCCEAVRCRWFETSVLVQQAADALFQSAANVALRQLIIENRVAEIDFMLGAKHIFNSLSMATVVEEVHHFNCIELAAHRGAAASLQYFLSQSHTKQKPRLVQLARNARQAISIVAIDFFIDSKPANLQHYDMLNDQGVGVLEECVRQQRSNLLRFCYEHVPSQHHKRNHLLQLAQKSCRDPAGAQRLRECIEFLSSV